MWPVSGAPPWYVSNLVRPCSPLHFSSFSFYKTTPPDPHRPIQVRKEAEHENKAALAEFEDILAQVSRIDVSFPVSSNRPSSVSFLYFFGQTTVGSRSCHPLYRSLSTRLQSTLQVEETRERADSFLDDIRAARALMENPNLLDDQSAPLDSASTTKATENVMSF
jgi:hypothetical protein